MENLREKQRVLAQVSSPSHGVLVEYDKYNQCEILINENKYLQNILEIFTKGRDNFNLFLVNHRALYIKVGLTYELLTMLTILVNFSMIRQPLNAKLLNVTIAI